MQACTVWQEMCWLLCIDEMSPPIQEAFELSKCELEALIPQASSRLSLPTDVAKDALNRELNSGIETEGNPFRKSRSRELARAVMLSKRLDRLSHILMANSRTPKTKRVLRGVSRFLTRFGRFRLKLMAEKHLTKDVADEVAFAVDAMPDAQELRKLVRKLRGLAEEEMVEGVLSSVPPALLLQGATVIVFHPKWTCKLEYAIEDDAEAAISILKSRYAQDRSLANKLRAHPTVSNLLSFLGRALPGDQVPAAIAIHAH